MQKSPKNATCKDQNARVTEGQKDSNGIIQPSLAATASNHWTSLRTLDFPRGYGCAHIVVWRAVGVDFLVGKMAG